MVAYSFLFNNGLSFTVSIIIIKNLTDLLKKESQFVIILTNIVNILTYFV